MRTVHILRGVPGAGKTTHLNTLPATIAVSANHYFTAEDGTYTFRADALSQAHAACLKRFLELVQKGEASIAVDNTNISCVEIAPYVAIGQAFGYEVEIVTLLCDAGVAANRNVHGVPTQKVCLMARRMLEEGLRFPPWWKHTVLQVA